MKIKSWHIGNALGGKKKEKLLSHFRLFATLLTVAYWASPSMGFSRQEYWSGLPFSSPGDLPDLEIKPGLPHCRQTLYRLSHQGSQRKGTHVFLVRVDLQILWRALWQYYKCMYLLIQQPTSRNLSYR